MKRLYQFESLLQENSLVHGVSQKSTNEKLLFSLALHTNEDKDLILSNRKKLASSFRDKNYYFIVANQTHSNHIKVIEERSSRGWNSLDDAVEDCDALISNQKGLILTVLTADCVPILLYDRVQKVIAVVHAGWRGTDQEIASKTISVMQTKFNSNPKDILVGIAPAIGACCYEVKEDVASHFFKYPKALSKKDNKYNLDLSIINQEQLLAIGIQKENIQMSGICTACSVESYFSYRQEGGCSGRFMSMIGLKEEGVC